MPLAIPDVVIDKADALSGKAGDGVFDHLNRIQVAAGFMCMAVPPEMRFAKLIDLESASLGDLESRAVEVVAFGLVFLGQIAKAQEIRGGSGQRRSATRKRPGCPGGGGEKSKA